MCRPGLALVHNVGFHSYILTAVLYLNVWCCCLQEDVCLSGYKKHLVSQMAAAPLTDAEYELAEIKRTEVGTY